MLKKILILSLILNTPYIFPSSSAPTPRYDVAMICAVAGAICTWLAYKDFKKGWQGYKEFNRHLKALNAMGIKVCKVSKGEFEFNSYVIKEHYTMDIPANFSQEQKKKAKEHWNLLLTSDKAFDKMLGWPATGSVILIPTAIWALFECIKLRLLDFNKN